MPKSLNEQVIVVTGASSGIGLVTAKEAARCGAKVVLAARNERDVFIGGGGKALSVGERISPKMMDLQMTRSGFRSGSGPSCRDPA